MAWQRWWLLSTQTMTSKWPRDHFWAAVPYVVGWVPCNGAYWSQGHRRSSALSYAPLFAARLRVARYASSADNAGSGTKCRKPVEGSRTSPTGNEAFSIGTSTRTIAQQTVRRLLGRYKFQPGGGSNDPTKNGRLTEHVLSLCMAGFTCKTARSGSTPQWWRPLF